MNLRVILVATSVVSSLCIIAYIAFLVESVRMYTASYNAKNQNEFLQVADDVVKRVMNSFREEIRLQLADAVHSENNLLLHNLEGSVQDQPKPIAPISLLYPCGERDIPRLHQVLKSIAGQTVYPFETILAISIKDGVSETLAWQDIAAAGIPNLRIMLRGGAHNAGDNRDFLMHAANSSIVSFVDCDDYILPQRTEILNRLFDKFPEIEAMIHTFVAAHRDQNDQYDVQKYVNKTISKEEVESWTPVPFEDLWNHPSVANYSTKEWVLGDPESEPNHPGTSSPVWWFPDGFNYHFRAQPHNAWLTIRLSTARSVPYPHFAVGEDSLYNWRLLKSHKNWTCLDLPLAVYVRPLL